MKRTLLALFIALTSAVALAQYTPKTITLTIDAVNPTISDSVQVPEGLYPAAIYVDSLTTPTLAHFEVSFGDSPTRRWFPLTQVSDTTAYDTVAYSISLADSFMIPLKKASMAPALGLPVGNTPKVWFRTIITTTQTLTKYLFIRFLPY